jgi:hypothetical protein
MRSSSTTSILRANVSADWFERVVAMVCVATIPLRALSKGKGRWNWSAGVSQSKSNYNAGSIECTHPSDWCRPKSTSRNNFAIFLSFDASLVDMSSE